jgi:AP-1 complex subunit beta-1
VQLQLLTAVVKLFLKKPEAGPQALIQSVLGKATTETDNPDLRDRAYIYWRLLAADPEAARDVVLADKPVIADDAAALEPALLDELLGQVATLASVYHKPAEAFVSRARGATQGVGLGEGGEEEEGAGAAAAAPAPYAPAGPAPRAPPPPTQLAVVPDLMGDLMGLDEPAQAAHAPAAPHAAPGGDLLGDLLSLDISGAPPPPPPHAPPPGAAAAPLPVVLAASAATGGLEISGGVVRGADGSPQLSLRFANRAAGGDALDGLQLQLNRNAVGLTLGAALALPPLGCGGAAADALLPLAAGGALAPHPAPPALQLAVKSPRSPAPGVFYFSVPLHAEALFLSGAPPDAAALAAAWRSLPDLPPRAAASALIRDAGDAGARLAAVGVHVAHARPLPDGGLTLYAGASLPGAPGGTPVVAELTCHPGVPGVRLAAKSTSPDAAALTLDALERLLV